ncbi:MAG: thiamine pyrophosphate-binding protein [Gammaproteobacteria bacterium]
MPALDRTKVPNIGLPLEIGDLLIHYLSQIGVEYVFGVPGGAIEPLYNALARSERKNGPRAIVARHETGAAFMADGYYYYSGKLGVCCATTGPGATNLTTGMCSAYQHRIPMLVITAQTTSNHFGRGAFQDSSCTGVDIMGIFEHCTRYNSLVSHIDQFEHKLVSALHHALGTTPGPVHLSIPVDIFRQETSIKKPSFDLSRLQISPATFDTVAFEQLKTILLKARKPVIAVGSYCKHAIKLIMDVASLLQAQVVTTPQGKGLVDPYHPLYRGVVGFAGHHDAHQVLVDSEVDVIIAIGTSLGEWATDGWNPELLLNDRMIHISEAEFDFSRSPQAQLHVLGNLETLFTKLQASLLKHYSVETIKTINKNKIHLQKTKHELHFKLDETNTQPNFSKPIKPQDLMLTLTEFFPDNTLYLADIGNSMAWATHYLNPKRQYDAPLKSRAYLRTSMEFAAMGWAIGASIGTALACPGDPVVCITGDGSMLMSGQEITVAIQQQLPVIFVILNDAGLGMVKHGQRLANAEAVGFELPKIDFAGIAHSMGMPGYVIRSSYDFERLDADVICRRAGPTILDVRIDDEQVPPMASRLQQLGIKSS